MMVPHHGIFPIRQTSSFEAEEIRNRILN